MSLFEIDRIKTIKATDNALNYVKDLRQKEIDKNIKYLMTPRKIFFFFTTKPMSREAAESKVMTDAWHKDEGVYLENYAIQLARACKMSENNMVQLNKEDANFVERWLRRNSKNEIS